MADTADPGAALPSRVQEYRRTIDCDADGVLMESGAAWCRECERILPMITDPGQHANDCPYRLIRDLASALQQTQAERDAANTQRDIAISRMQQAEATAIHPEQFREAEAAHQRLRDALNALTTQWRADAAEWHKSERGDSSIGHAFDSCARKLEAALVSPESAA